MNNRILELAFAFAESKEQAHFINEMGRSLKHGCKGGNLEMQLCRMTDGLNEHGKFLITELMRFLENSP